MSSLVKKRKPSSLLDTPLKRLLRVEHLDEHVFNINWVNDSLSNSTQFKNKKLKLILEFLRIDIFPASELLRLSFAQHIRPEKYLTRSEIRTLSRAFNLNEHLFLSELKRRKINVLYQQSDFDIKQRRLDKAARQKAHAYHPYDTVKHWPKKRAHPSKNKLLLAKPAPNMQKKIKV